MFDTVNLFLFRLISTVLPGAPRLRLISIAGLALILQYGYRVLGIWIFNGSEFPGRLLPADERFMRQIFPAATKTSRSGQA